MIELNGLFSDNLIFAVFSSVPCCMYSRFAVVSNAYKLLQYVRTFSSDSKLPCAPVSCVTIVALPVAFGRSSSYVAFLSSKLKHHVFITSYLFLSPRCNVFALSAFFVQPAAGIGDHEMPRRSLLALAFRR